MRKASGDKKVWKKPLEIRKKHSENWHFEQEGAVGTVYPELCLVFELGLHGKAATQLSSFEITGKSECSK